MGSKTFFRTMLRCTRCGTLNDGKKIDLSSPVGGEPDWDFVEPGEVVDAGVDDLEGPLLLLHRPDGDRVFVLEFFVCESCRAYSPALIELRVRSPYVLEFVGATAVPALTREVFDKAHFVSDKIGEWTPQPGEDEELINRLKNKR